MVYKLKKMLILPEIREVQESVWKVEESTCHPPIFFILFCQKTTDFQLDIQPLGIKISFSGNSCSYVIKIWLTGYKIDTNCPNSRKCSYKYQVKEARTSLPLPFSQGLNANMMARDEAASLYHEVKTHVVEHVVERRLEPK